MSAKGKQYFENEKMVTYRHRVLKVHAHMSNEFKLQYHILYEK